jgi:hypothetical protein
MPLGKVLILYDPQEKACKFLLPLDLLAHLGSAPTSTCLRLCEIIISQQSLAGVTHLFWGNHYWLFFDILQVTLTK